MITVHTAACRAMHQFLEEESARLKAARDNDADDICLAILEANVRELERMLGAIEGV